MVDKHLKAGGEDTTVHNRLLPLLAISEGVYGAEREKIGYLSLARSESIEWGGLLNACKRGSIDTQKG